MLCEKDFSGYFDIDSCIHLYYLKWNFNDSAYVLAYSGTVMVSLGWVGGVVGLIIAIAISLYVKALIAHLHKFGRKRYIRYRDLAGFVYGN